MLKTIRLISTLLLISSCSSLSNSTREIASIHDSRNCLDTINSFMRTNPTKSGPILIGANSLGPKIPDFEEFRSLMLSKRPSIENFVKRFKEQNQGNSPTNLQVLEFYSFASEDLASHIRSAKGIDERLDRYLEFSAAQIELAPSKLEKIAEFKTDPELMREAFDLSSRKITDPLGWTNYKGHLGELDVLLRLEDLQAQGVYLRRIELLDPKAQKINDIFSSRLEEKLPLVNETNLPSYMEKFPRIFKADDNFSDDEIISRATVFLQTKEFDLVIKKNNKYSLVEVKNYKQPIGLREASEGTGYKKTVLDQQLETIEIIHFLGLEDEFFPTVAFLRGVTPEARAVFESRGISVLAEVIQ